MPEYLFLVSLEGLPVKWRCVFSSEPELAPFLVELERTLALQKGATPFATPTATLSEYFVQIWDTDFEDFAILESIDQVHSKGKIHLQLRPAATAPEALLPP